MGYRMPPSDRIKAGRKRLLFWLFVIAAYWYCARYLLFFSFPVYVDDGGPVASFFWGNHPALPTYGQWETSWRARFEVVHPYLTAAAIITFCGCGLTTWLVRRWMPRRSHLFFVGTTTTLVSLLLLEVASDTCTALGIWRAPTAYGWIDLVVIFKIMIPMSLVAGGIAVAHDRLTRQPPAASPL